MAADLSLKEEEATMKDTTNNARHFIRPSSTRDARRRCANGERLA
jgi:hypothetical protein